MFSTKTAQFAWKNIIAIIGGRPIAGITDIEYKTDKDIDFIYGAGDSPQFIGEGNKSCSGTIELLQNDYEALVEAAKNGGGDDITDLEVSIVVSYIPKGTANLPKTVVDRLVGVKFSSDGKKMTQGDKFLKISLPFLCLGIEHQI
ncbi:MAG: hypothetical protein LBN98_03515 [Prevotellaceae bacterium]|jgi:hypothetical protein|nr:hypothetical protein [Prevotellaceae bacterium]